MLNFDWLNNLRTGRTSLSKRRRSANRSLARQANVECLQSRAMLSGNPVATMAMGESGADSGHTSSMHQTSTTAHAQHAHPAAMALVSADQATNTVTASGNWSDSAVWQNGELPTAGARIIIPQGMTLTVDSVIPHEFKTIGIHGTLSFATDVNTELRVDTIVSSPHGRFEMGTAANPIAANVTAKVVFSDDGAIDTNWDPEQLSRGAVLQGPTEIHGAETTHQVSLASHPAAGATILQLSSVPTTWKAGDEIIITGTQGPTSDEVRTIQSIDGTTVTLNQALQLDHIPPQSGLNVYVANTTRNVELTSENPATARRGHVMFMHTNNVNVNHAAFTQLGRTDKKIPLDDTNFEFPEVTGNLTSAGVVFTATPGERTNVRGRYPVHFHRGGTQPGSTPGIVDGSVVVGSPGYGLVNHSSNVILTNNVSYDIHGSAFYTEAGDEIGTIENNIAIRTVNPNFRLEDNGEISVDLRADVQDFGVDGDGFWLSGHLVSMKNNIASGASGHGIIIWSDGLVEADRGRTTVRTADIANGHLIQGRDTIPTWWAPLAEISNNEASNATIGFRARYIHSSIYLGEVGSTFHEPPSQEYIDTLRPEINGLTVWGSRDGALLNYNERLSLKNAHLVGIGAPYVRQDGTTDLGVGIDMYNDVSRGPGVVENVTVEGFNMGILAPRHNEWQMDNIHLRNTTDLHIEQVIGASRVLTMNNVTFGDLIGTAVAGNEGQRQNVVMKADDTAEQPFWFLLTDTVSMNGQGLYFDQQAANYVPMTQDLRGDSRAPVPTEFVGLTNQQLQDQYGTSFAGEITPDDAQTAPWLSNGVVGSLAAPGHTSPPLYDMRDGGDIFAVVEFGTLTNFDPNVLGNGDDENEDTDESDEGDDENEDTDESDEGDDENEDTDESDEGDDETGDVFAVTGTLVGSNESEKLQGFESDDVITGNGGPDLFPFTAGNDVITDFDPGEDMIDVGDFARSTDDFAVLTSLAAIAANSSQTTIDGETTLVIDVDGEMGDWTTTLLGVTIDDLNESNVFFGLDGESIPPLAFTHIPETTVTLNEGTVASFPGHDLSVHPLPFELVSGSQASVDALNGGGGSDEESDPDDEEIDDDGLDPEDEPEDTDETDEGDDENEDTDETGGGDDENEDTDETDEGDDENEDTDETDEGDDENEDTDETDEGDDENEDTDETDEGDDENEDTDETDEGDDENEDTDETDEGDDENEDTDETDEGDDENEDTDETDEGDDENEDTDETDEGEDENEDTDETDEGEDENEDTDETDEGEDENEDTDETGEGGDMLPELETPQGAFTLTLPESGGDTDIVVAGSELLVLSGDAATRHVELSGVTSLTIQGGDSADFVLLDLEEASPLGLESITVNGGSGNDRIQVQGYRDEIATTLTVNGDDGNDSVLVASSGSTVNLNGGDGNDRLDGGQGADNIDGGAGNDILQGRGGNDVLRGGDGNDRLNGHGGNDTMSGGSGRDRINGHSGQDVLRGDDGNDVLAGGGGNDLLLGGDGRDRMRGQGGDDTMIGGDGADILKGGGGNDAVESGTDDDIKQGGRGIDALITSNGGGREFTVLGQVITSDDFASVASNSDSEEERFWAHFRRHRQHRSGIRIGSRMVRHDLKRASG